MNEELNQVNQTNSNEEVKTFTQEEVNRIVSERLNREKGKIDADREAEYSKREAELNTREIKLKARESLSEKNLPSELIDVINCSNEEELERSLEILERVYKDKKEEPQFGFFPIGGNGGNTSYGGGTDPIKQAMGLQKG